jgi:membrane fusion protein (multidrug efflux system)
MKKKIIAGVIVIVITGFAGVKVFSKGKAGRQMPPPAVQTAKVTESEIIDKIKTNGRVEAIDNVDITARVEGYLQKKYFEEGAFVKKGDLLFLIEPDRYAIGVQNANATIENARAALNEAEKNLIRASELLKLDYISKAQYDDSLAKRDMAKAMLKSTYASLNQANLSLNYTRIYSPISGQIGRINITEGNTVSPLTGAIAKIVSIDPVYINFDIRSEQYISLKKISDNNLKAMDVEIELPDGSKYPLKGAIEFYNNEIDPTTGTIKVRASFKNPDRLLIPGQYLAVTLSSKKPRKVALIPQESVVESSYGKMVFALTPESTVKAVPVVIDGESNGNWIVKSGLKTGETIVAKGVHKLRPDAKVMVIPDKALAAPVIPEKTGGKKDVR